MIIREALGAWLINKDAASIARERLGGGQKELLAEWFRDRRRGERGRRLLHRAASVDARLSAIAAAAELEDGPQLEVRAAFGFGLLVGAILRLRGVDGDLVAALEALFAEQDEVERAALAAAPLEGPAALTGELLELDPELDHALFACFRLAMDASPRRSEAVARLLFFAGLLAMGFDAPVAVETELHSVESPF